MNGLIPVQRPDKNGVMVTRWVKPVSGEKASSAIPAPSVTAVSSGVMDDLEWHLGNYDVADTESAEVLLRHVPEMGDTAKEFVQSFSDQAGASDLVFNIADVVDEVYGSASTVPVEHRGTVIMNYMGIIPEYFEGKDNDGVYAAHFAHIVFRGIGGYTATEPWSDDEKRVYKEAAAITEAIFPVPSTRGHTHAGYRSADRKVDLESRESVDILMNNISHLDMISSELMLRKTFDAEIVRQVAAAGVLADGTL